MPLEIQQAYQAGTRNADGTAGEHYWQNKAEYDIAVEVFPDQKKLQGVEQVTYFNNSPDTLQSVWIHLYADFYKKGNARDETIALVNITEGVIINSIKLDGKDIDMGSSQVERHTTNLQLHLEDPLLPEDSLALEIAWEEILPAEYHNRIGAYDSTTFMVGYWYPQIAVYDDIDGWDTFAYGGIQEFYREFSDYRVEITLPEHYYVWATGELLNAESVYAPEIKQRWELARQSDTTVLILSGRQDYPDPCKEKKTWVYTAENVGDFAFGFSDYFRWEASSAQPVGTAERVLVSMVYDPQDSLLMNQLTHQQTEMIDYFSEQTPGVNYPYSHFTTFVGCPIYDGMEFPMMANNGVFRKDNTGYMDVRITAHELAHTYFPFLVGINERKYTWMEEGWAVYFTTQYLENYEPDISRTQHMAHEYQKRAGSMYDLPMLVANTLLGNASVHRHAAYNKPFVAYQVLQALLGEVLFQQCLKAYIERWTGKHPTPYDFFNTFSDVSGQNLNWFWKAWFQDFSYADLGIIQSDEGEVLLQNTGGLPLPATVTLSYANGDEEHHTLSAEVWKEQNEVKIPVDKNRKLINASLLLKNWPDANYENNKLYP